jgi:hypothetical protein
MIKTKGKENKGLREEGKGNGKGKRHGVKVKGREEKGEQKKVGGKDEREGK